ncbi:cyclin-dependent protein kinase inhibitor SMR4 [Prosopis cineraria]|uniref:cyclin-dependent protein kinase inhibitor SMR4 n=1 Tax=Prosopis cineraria TaxID=364024 RepID=UPI00240FF96E|nr:cyclin-dependent protein kinase inhibitor SMR4 [Prosopis cineraria]
MAAVDKSGMREWEEECKTPRNIENRIPAMLICPPPPRKKPIGDGKRRDPPKGGYFNPPDLDSFFDIPPRKEAFA